MIQPLFASTIQAKTGPISPGREFGGLLTNLTQAGHPVWHVMDRVVVPRTPWPQPPRKVLRPVVYLAMCHPRLEEVLLESRTAEKQLCYLAAAAAIDLLAMSHVEVAEALGKAVDADDFGSKSIRNARRKGRRLWSEALGAWPWRLFGRGELPRDWYRQPAVSDAFDAWASGAADELFQMPIAPASRIS
jgi:hypothetical protein